MRISDWSSDVCSSDLIEAKRQPDAARLLFGLGIRHVGAVTARDLMKGLGDLARLPEKAAEIHAYLDANPQAEGESDGKYLARKVEAIKSILEVRADGIGVRSDEHTSELQSLMRNSYAVFCLKKKKKK